MAEFAPRDRSAFVPVQPRKLVGFIDENLDHLDRQPKKLPISDAPLSASTAQGCVNGVLAS
jgi:hypothetical protein